MLSRLTMELKKEDSVELIGIQKSSLLQGVMMQQIDPEYAGKMHMNGLRPYSEWIKHDAGKAYWIVQTLNEEAYGKIILPLLRPTFKEILIENDQKKYEIVSKTVIQKKKQELLDNFFFGECDRSVRIEFLAPTAFKTNGQYRFYPDIRLIYQSLMNRYDAFSEENQICSEEVLEELSGNTYISQYNLRSMNFYLEGVKIPSFRGNVTLRIKGPQQLVNLAGFLLHYGEFSGVGIKTAIGMGAYQIVERGDQSEAKRAKASDRSAAL